MPASRVICALLAAILTLYSPPVGRASGPEELQAVFWGEPIALSDVRNHHCHDGQFPKIRCFSTDEERDTDAGLVTSDIDLDSGAAEIAQLASSYYVVWYEHSNYAGLSYLTSVSHANLTTIGWNDAISSFKSLNGGRPKWWEHSDYAGSSWQWAAGAWVSYVGNAANDRWSSVKNVP